MLFFSIISRISTNLPHEGTNPHRLRIGKDVLETKMI
jgi:hypothetical protein